MENAWFSMVGAGISLSGGFKRETMEVRNGQEKGINGGDHKRNLETIERGSFSDLLVNLMDKREEERGKIWNLRNPNLRANTEADQRKQSTRD